MSGRAERYLPDLLRPFTQRGWWLKKNTDYSRLLGGKEPGVDYYLAMTGVQIEVKNSNKDGVLKDRPTKVQRALLDKYGGFIFLIMWDPGYPRLPEGGDAYLVPWEAYKSFEETVNTRRRSVRRRRGRQAWGADELLGEYQLVWKDGRWIIPPAHPFWDELIRRANELDLQIKDMMRWRREQLQLTEVEHVCAIEQH